MFEYKGKVVAVTGASSGLGRQMALTFADQGADLVVMARRIERLEELKDEIEKKGVRCLPLKCDVTDTDMINDCAKKAIDTFGKVDVLVNNAGSSKGGAVYEMTDEAWEFTIDTDLTSVFKVTRAFSKHMVDRGYGRIINIASMYGLLGTNQQESAYHASKAGVINFTRAAAAELAPHGITVNAICPGFFPTELTEETLATDAFKQYVGLVVPMKRNGKVTELAPAAIFLGSEEASYVTGVALPVDGGWSSTK